MRKFEILPHTADIRLKVEAEDLKDLFVSALEGMNFIIKNDFSKKESLMNFRDVITVNSYDVSILLVDFLSKILTLSHQYKALFHTVKFLHFNENSLNALVEGDKIKGFDEDIKAVTYNEVEIRKNEKNNYETLIVFDI
ncbi:MAG: archease [Ignavibacteria bacterium]